MSQQQQDSRSRAARRRARYRQIAAVFWEERLWDLVKGAGLEEHLAAEMHIDHADASGASETPLAIRVRRALERLGPVYVKIGQILASRSDLLPPTLLEELSKLQDDVAPVEWQPIRERVETELGAPISELFESFDETPLAAASIGQVYRATLPGGTRVAVKVQRPGVAEALEIDLDIMRDLASRLTKHFQWARDCHLAKLTEEFSAVLRSELDYTDEACHIDRFRGAFAEDETLVFPVVHWDFCSGRVLTTDLVSGIPATELQSAGDSLEVDREQVVRTGVDAYFRMIFEMGFYHADPHAGNLFAMPDGRLGFVDFGRVASVSQRNREAVFDLLLAVCDDDPAGVTDAIIHVAGLPSQADLAALEADVTKLLANYREQQSSGKGLTKMLQGLMRLLRDHRLEMPSELTVLLSTLGVLDGVAIQIDPGFRLLDVARPYAGRLMPERYGPRRFIGESVRSARSYMRFFEQLPVQATRVLRRISEGEFKLVVRPSEFEELVDRLTSGVYLLGYSIIVGALIIGFSFLVAQQNLSHFERVAYRVVLYGSITSVLWLLLRSMVYEWRKRKTQKEKRV